jgi:hypothetical protein
MTDPPCWPPRDVDGCIRVVGPWPPEGGVVNHGLLGQVEMDALVAVRDCLIWYLHDPEQTRLRDVPVEIVDLCSRTGIKEVNSYEHKDSTMVRAVGRDVLAAIETHVRAHVVSVAVTVGRSSR